MAKKELQNKMTIPQIQYSIFNKICVAYKKLKEIPTNYYLFKETSDNLTFEQRKESIELNISAESYLMLIINGLLALLGERKKDKLSIPNCAMDEDKESIKDFLIRNYEEIGILHKLSDNFYNYRDDDNADKNMFIGFIDICITFMNNYFNNLDELKPENVVRYIKSINAEKFNNKK